MDQIDSSSQVPVNLSSTSSVLNRGFVEEDSTVTLNQPQSSFINDYNQFMQANIILPFPKNSCCVVVYEQFNRYFKSLWRKKIKSSKMKSQDIKKCSKGAGM